MKRITYLAVVYGCLFLGACADFKLAGVSVETPYGTITSDKGGAVTVVVKPIVIGEK